MDALRYYLLRETVFGQDGNFSYDASVTRYNSDLSQRPRKPCQPTAAMVEKNCGGKFLSLGRCSRRRSARDKRRPRSAKFWSFNNKLGFSRALELIWSLIAAADKYLASEQPWVLSAPMRQSAARHNSLDRC